MTYEYQTISTRLDAGVLFAVISNPPVNVMTPEMYMDLVAFTKEVEKDEEVRVVVFESADPDFFIAHFDLETLLVSPIDKPAQKGKSLSEFHQMCQRVKNMPKATIVKMAGRAGGGGNEFASSCDMRYGIRNKTIINQMEVALGILPGGSGTQNLPRLIGRGRAMEVCLGSDDIDAETLERWGYLNRIFETEEQLNQFVDRLAMRIAGWPAEAIALCKQSVNNAELPIEDGLLEEAYLFQQTMRTDGAQTNMQKAMDLGAQTREGELRMGELCAEVAEAANNK
ncbi:MAG: enoyl-CoA hydratase/isomerase family protein [Pseudomonadales bacterium]|jgi:enoyl-CoA hydratase/carnithine racemase